MSVAAIHCDLGGRSEANADVGTNGARAYTRPETAPVRSDAVLKTSYSYDDAGNLLEVRDPKGIVTHYEYDALGRTTKTIAAYTDGIVTDSSNQTTEYTYDGADHVLTRKAVLPDGLFQETRYIYGASQSRGDAIDSIDILVATQYPDPSTGLPSAMYQESYVYDALGEVLATTHANEAVDVITYNRPGRVSSRQTLTTDGSGSPLTQYHYNVFGELIDQTDPRGAVTQYQYDSLGRLAAKIEADPDGAGPLTSPATQYQYDNAGRVTQVTDPAGAVTVHQYDLLGRKTQTTLADPATGGQSANSPVITYAYNVNGDTDTITDALGNTTQTQYDPFGRVAQVTQPDPDGAGPETSPNTQHTYDRDGNVASVMDAAGNTTSYQYDNLGRKIQVTAPDPDGSDPLAASVTTYQYDINNNLIATTDPLSHTTNHDYDLQNRQTAVFLPSPDGIQSRPTTLYTYDVVGHLQTLTDPSGNATTYSYNQLGQQTGETNELAAARTSVYDANGNQTRHTDRNGRVRTFTYDALNRKTAENWLDSNDNVIRTFSYAYDADGRLSSVTDSGGVTTSITYDFLGRVHTIDQTLPSDASKHFILTYGYDANGRTTSLTGTLDGVAQVNLAYTWDDAGRMTRITDNLGDKRVDFTYNALGQYLTLTRYANAAGTELVATSSYDYDAANRMTSLTHALSDSGATTLSYALQYDANDQITQLTTPDGVSDYTLDNTGQLTAASLTSESYEYDANGNRTNGGTVTSTDNRLLEDATYTYTYDHEGNLLTRTAKDGSGGQSFTWDYRNRLTDVTDWSNPSGMPTYHTTEYAYDAFDRRNAKTDNPDVPPDWRQYLYEGTGDADVSLVLDWDGNVQLRQLNAPGSNQVLAEDRIGETTTATRWALADHEGSVRDIVDNAAAVVDHIQYDSFGNILSQTNAAELTLATYTGAPTDGETGFVYLHRRYFDPTTGRWLSQDPISFAGGDTNLYRYVGNGPVNATDPSGLCKKPGSFHTLDWLYGDNLSGLADAYAIEMAGHSFSGADLARYGEMLRQLGYSRDQVDAQVNPFAQMLTERSNAALEAARWEGGMLTPWERAQGSLSILAATGSFGFTDATGLTDSGRYDSQIFDAAHVGSTVAREAAITLATMGASAASQAGRGLAYGAVALAGEGYSTYQNGASVYAGVQNLREGNAIGALQIAGGAFGLKGNVTAGMTIAPRLGADARSLVGELSQYRLTYDLSYAGSGLGSLQGVGIRKIAAQDVSQTYSVSFEHQLGRSELGLSRYEHTQIANEALQTARTNNASLAQLVPAPAPGRAPAGWTWQHATSEQAAGRAGVLQLVPRAQHTPGSTFWSVLHPLPGGAGGYSQWAIPAGAPKN